VCVFAICTYLHFLCSVCVLIFIVLWLFCCFVFFMFCSFVVIVVLLFCVFIFSTSVGLLPPGKSPIAVRSSSSSSSSSSRNFAL
jgi:uncharacterized membrane protein